jgi:hypothetical protein
MATLSKLMLSESADGDGIEITTASPIDGSDTLIHTAVSGTTDKDLITLFAYNDDTLDRVLHLKWGDSGDSIKQTIPSQAGLVLIVADLPISDGNTITASASAVNMIWIYGDVKRIDA